MLNIATEQQPPNRCVQPKERRGMKRTFKILGLSLLIITQSCGLKNKNDNVPKIESSKTDLFDKYSNDSIRDRIFEIAYDNKSTAPSYIVFKAKDLNTGLIKEICCEVPFLTGAMHRELEIEYDSKGTEYIDSIILANRQENFEFKNEEALNNICFFEYPDYNRLLQIAEGINLDYYSKTFGKNDSTKLLYFETDTGFIQTTFTHIMFNCGIMTKRDCEASNNIWFVNPNR